MGKTVIKGPDIEYLETTSDFMETDNYSGVGYIYRYGKLCLLRYSCTWGGFTANQLYTVGKLKERFWPHAIIVAPGLISANGQILNGAARVCLNTDGLLTVSTGNHYGVSLSGYPDIWLVYLCK